VTDYVGTRTQLERKPTFRRSSHHGCHENAEAFTTKHHVDRSKCCVIYPSRSIRGAAHVCNRLKTKRNHVLCCGFKSAILLVSQCFRRRFSMPFQPRGRSSQPGFSATFACFPPQRIRAIVFGVPIWMTFQSRLAVARGPRQYAIQLDETRRTSLHDRTSTCRHLLLRSGLTFISISTPFEVPILDAPPNRFLQLLEQAGIRRLPPSSPLPQNHQNCRVLDHDRRIGIYPADDFAFQCYVDFPHPWSVSNT